MIARALAAMAVALLASPGSGQTIRVQSGDHPGFTRLVLPIGADREWRLEQQSGTAWTLTLIPAINAFDLSAAFNLIQRTRLADLTGDDALQLALACACGVESFRFDDRYLVIDISDPDPDAAPEEPTAPPPQTRRQAAAALPDLADLLVTDIELPNVALGPRAAAPITGSDPSGPNLDTSGPTGAHNARLAEAAEIMAEQLARAAAAGLLDASLDQPMTFGDPSEPRPTEPESPVVPAERAADAPNAPVAPDMGDFPSGPLPIHAETAFDTAIQLDLPISAPRNPAACQGIPINVRDWASGSGFDHELGALRQTLYDERDTLLPDRVIALARHYLFHGFGAEAAYWLTQLEDPPRDLIHLAALVDGAPSAGFPDVEAPEACSMGELLWRYLAGAVPDALSQDDAADVQRAYGELSSELRDLMGPRLARQLHDAGHADAARNIRDALHRGGRVDATILRRLDFDLGIAPLTSAENTRSALAEALRDDGGDPVSIMALALAFDRSIGQRPAAARLDAAAALLRETGDRPETDALWHEILLGHAALGQVDRALNMLADPGRSDAARARALTDLIAERVLVGDTAALVVIAYTHGASWRPDGSAAGRVQVQAIAALRDAGLFEAAQILRDVRRPLILPAPEAAPAGPADDVRTAWQGRDWARLADVATGPLGEVGARMAAVLNPATPPPDPETGGPDLNAMADAVDDSRALRATLAALLSRPSPP